MLLSRMNAGNPAHLWRFATGEKLGIFALPLLIHSLSFLLPPKVRLPRKRLTRKPFAASRLKRNRMNSCVRSICNSSEMNTSKFIGLKTAWNEHLQKNTPGTPVGIPSESPLPHAHPAQANTCFHLAPAQRYASRIYVQGRRCRP
jgi:hypothetical protein